MEKASSSIDDPSIAATPPEQREDISEQSSVASAEAATNEAPDVPRAISADTCTRSDDSNRNRYTVEEKAHAKDILRLTGTTSSPMPADDMNEPAINESEANQNSSDDNPDSNNNNSNTGSNTTDSAYYAALARATARFDNMQGRGQLRFLNPHTSKASKKDCIIDPGNKIDCARLINNTRTNGRLSFLPDKGRNSIASSTSSHFATQFYADHQVEANGGRETLERGTRSTDRAQNNNNRVMSQPGAFSAGPSNNSGHGFPEIDPTEPLPSNNGILPARNTTGDYQLAVASTVEDDTADLLHASPVDWEGAQRRERQQNQQQQFFIAALIWLLLLAAIIVGFVVRTHRDKNSDTVTLSSTESPTVFGSMTPSELPSSAPTGVLDLLLDSLPSNTLASINNGSDTPQWKAWQWLANHQNITNLPEWRKEQLFALATFFYAFEGENWNPLIKARWMDDTKEECEWFSSGFGYFSYYDGKYYEYDSLELGPCNELGKFTSLWLEDLQLSGLTPVVLPEILLLTSLFHLRLTENKIGMSLSKILPFQHLQELTALMDLWLYGNAFTGQIPSELGLISSLRDLRIYFNHLTGKIPSELGQMTALTDLYLDTDNRLTGRIPSELGQLTALTWLRLVGLLLTGQIPSELGQLTALSSFSLQRNQLTGQTPSDLSQLTALTGLFLYDNQLNGSLPSELGQLKSASLWLNHNQLSGQIPSELGQLVAFHTWLLLHENQLTGPIPIELAQLTSLRWLQLNGNLLTGEIPPMLGQMTALTNLLLQGNLLSGQIPCDLGQLTGLTGLSLQENQLTGKIPSHLGQLTRLKELFFRHNQLTGSLPSEIGLATALFSMDLHSNQLSGTVATELALLTSLVDLWLSDNIMLTGSIPAEIGLLTKLGLLDLTGSFGLSGTIPQEKCILQSRSCTYKWGNDPCFLGFDCTSRLCGCDCACTNSSL